MSAFEVTRRQLIRGSGVAALAVGAGALAACGGPAATTSSPPQTSAASPGGTPATGGTGQPAGVKVAKADVPVGGGKLLPDDNLVVTQPTTGQFHAFSGTCTHQQCPLAAVRDGAIVCDCHGSKFSLTDGAPQTGPARSPLDTKTVTAQGEDLFIS